MADKFQNKYRIPSARLPHWNYGWNAAYFVTICTKDRECFFGEIVNGEMNLSDMGKIVQTEWSISLEIRLDMKLELDAFVVMPNYFQSKNLASIIRGFKSSVTVKARSLNAAFAWQPRFHDHIIGDDQSFQNISNYILNNPGNWLG